MINSESLVFGDLSEQEIRSIIRRRIIFEELRHSTAQKMILSEVTSGLSISSFAPLTKALSSVPFVDDASMAAVLPWLLTTAEAVLFGSGAALAASMMPGGFLLKTYAFAKVCAYGYMFHKLVAQPFIAATQEDVNPKTLFLSTSQNACKGFVDGLANFIATKDSDFIMPQLPSNFESTNSLVPGTSSRNDYQTALDNLSSTNLNPAVVTDFLGIPLTNFTGRNVGNTTIYNGALTSGMHAIYRQVASVLVDEALASQDGEALIIKLANQFDAHNLTIHDLHFVDKYFGIALKSDSRVDWGPGGVGGSKHFRISKVQYERSGVDDPGESCIYYAIKNFDTMGSAMGGAVRSLPFMGGVAATVGIEDDNEINDYIRDILNVKNIKDNQKRYAKIMISKSDLLDRVRPYVGGDTSRVETAIASNPSGGTYINSNFPETLRASILDVVLDYADRAKRWLEDAWDWIKTKVTDATDAFINFWDASILPALATIGQKIVSFDFEGAFDAFVNILRTAWNKMTDFFTGLTNTTAGSSSGGSSGGTTSGGSSGGGTGSSQAASARNSNSTVRRMQNLMNRHVENTGMNVDPTEIDGIWGNDTTRLFDAISGEAFTSGIFKDDPDADKLSQGGVVWSDMSKMLTDKNGPQYSNYTPDEEGAFEMIRDIYYNETGNVDDQQKEDDQDDNRDTRGTRGEGGRLGRNNIGVEVIAGNTTDDELEKIGFPEETTNNLTDAVLTSIKSMNHTGGMVVLKVTFARRSFGRYDKGEVINIKKDETQSRARMISYRFLRRKIKEILTSSNSRVDVDSIQNKSNERGRKGRFTLILRIPPGAKRF
jgi:hypothetical protein|tara:strand:+ start:2391 stop:4874 length:2484 start_codon:yes stop_codon:yes gene_type:complete